MLPDCLLHLNIPMAYNCKIVMFVQILSKLFCHSDTAVFAARTADADDKLHFTFFHVLRQKERNQILGAQKEDIQKLAALVEAVLSDNQICVVGSETAIEKAEDVFMEVKPLIG